MDYEQTVAEAKQLVARALATVKNDSAPAEDKAKVTEWMKMAQDLQAKAAQYKGIADMGAQLAEMEQKNADAAQAAKQAPAGEFKSWGEFLCMAHKAGRGGGYDSRLRVFTEQGENKALSEGVGASGGFLVPDQFLTELRSAQGEANTWRSRATIIPMTRPTVKLPVVDQTASTAGIPHWYGGMKVYWLEEAAQKTETTPSFRQVLLTAFGMAAITYASDELLADSAISLQAFLQGPQGFVGAVNWMEEYAFLRGTGAGQPLGVLNAGCTISQARTATSPAIQYVDLAAMYAHFMPGAKGVWYINTAARETLLTMNGPSANPSYLWGSAISGEPNTLLGMPVVWTEKLPAVGSAGDVLLADPSYYLVGDRQATTVDSTIYNRFEYDQTTWRVVHRVGGMPWLSAPIYLADGSHTVSPFVILGAKTT